ncbi:hypothetical protein B566_EDAN017266 [Ephemera danica]|nr:hypothetical protein B566_EDAN017266 [Ephemera danica]
MEVDEILKPGTRKFIICMAPLVLATQQTPLKSTRSCDDMGRCRNNTMKKNEENDCLHPYITDAASHGHDSPILFYKRLNQQHLTCKSPSLRDLLQPVSKTYSQHIQFTSWPFYQVR